MKAQMLKIAGVKSEKEFYKKFPTEESFMAKYGKKLKKAQEGIDITSTGTGLDMDIFDAPSSPSSPTLPGMGIINSGIQGFQALGAEKENLARARQMKEVSGMSLKAMRSDNSAEEVARQRQDMYVRPEDNITTGEELFPTYGVGTNVLAKKGAMLKNYQEGGFMNFMNAGGSDVLNKGVNSFTNDSGGAQIGSAAADALKFIPGVGPVASALAKPILKTVGHLALSQKKQNQTKKAQEATRRNIQDMSGMQVGNFLQNKNKFSMKEGGNMNNDSEGAQTLWGGDLETLSYNPYAPGDGVTEITEGQMHTESTNGKSGIGMQYGGNMVEAEDGEPIVKIAEDGTSMSNEESSISIMGDLPLPKGFAKSALATTGEKIKGGKFKTFIKNLGDLETSVNKKKEKNNNKATDLIPYNKLDKITLNTLKLNDEKVYNPKLAALQDVKEGAAILQESINQTAEEQGLDAKLLSQGVAKKGKKLKNYQEGTTKPILNQLYPDEQTWTPSTTGTAFEQAYENRGIEDSMLSPEEYNLKLNRQNISTSSNSIDPEGESIATAKAYSPVGATDAKNNVFGDTTKEGLKRLEESAKMQDWWIESGWDTDFTKRGNLTKFQELFNANNPGGRQLKVDGLFGPQMDSISFNVNSKRAPIKDITGKVDTSINKLTPIAQTTNQTTDSGKKGKFDYMDVVNQIPQLFGNKSDAEPFDNRQLIPELYAMSNNQQEPVNAQKYTPRLDTPYDISLQDSRNDIISQARAIEKMQANNPALAGMSKAEVFTALNENRGEESRLNQAKKDQVYSGNRKTLNDADLKNLAIMDTQYGRQAQAKSNTKATTQAALSSISDKIAKNSLENKTLRIYENMYDYKYDPSGRARYVGDPLNVDAMRNNTGTGASKQAPPGMIYNGQDSKGRPLWKYAAEKAGKTPDFNPVSKNGSILKAYKKY